MLKMINGAMIEMTPEEEAAIAADLIPSTKQEKLDELKEVFLQKSARPRVAVSLPREETPLTFAVDGSYADLTNFQTGKALGLLQVRDADDAMRDIILSDYDTIILAIQANGLALMQAKWTHEAQINMLTTAGALNQYDITAGWPQ